MLRSEYYVYQYAQYFFKIENKSTFTSAQTTFNHDLTFGINGPGGIGQTLAYNESTSLDLAIFDGTIDFAGISGYQKGNVGFNEYSSGELSGGLAPFIGNGNVTFTENSNASHQFFGGGGNWQFEIQTQVSAEIVIIYTYELPETEIPVEFEENLTGSVCDPTQDFNQNLGLQSMIAIMKPVILKRSRLSMTSFRLLPRPAMQSVREKRQARQPLSVAEEQLHTLIFGIQYPLKPLPLRQG